MPYTKEVVLAAIDASIENWKERVTSDVEITPTTTDCPLCQLFIVKNGGVDCSGCPIFEHTKIMGCVRTPCISYTEACENIEDSYEDTTIAQIQALHTHAQAEIEFLIMIREEFVKSKPE